MSSENERVTVVFHNVPADLLREFAVNIVKPYFGGNMNAALRTLMERAVQDEEVLKRVKR